MHQLTVQLLYLMETVVVVLFFGSYHVKVKMKYSFVIIIVNIQTSSMQQERVRKSMCEIISWSILTKPDFPVSVTGDEMMFLSTN